MKHSQSVRLSKYVIPKKYVLHLRPDLEAFVFEGEESIHLTLKKPARSLTLHCVDIEIDSACIKGAEIAQKITYDQKSETATLWFEKPVKKGNAICELKFRGILNDRMHGFYRSSFEHEGKTKHIATTQFESTDARRAFPCFDEPAQKAIFDISLTVPKDKTAISNTMPIDIKEHEGGYKTVHFSNTPPMSTYLAAFIVGDFECIEKKSKDGVLVRVFTTPGKTHQARFALDCAARTITFFNKYFGIPYPMPVVDLIAIPDFAAGAMENWGAITYRESALLVDESESSTMNKQWVALVIAHELAHQWFGNLVTMEWWTHLWLNEGFASYIEYLAVDHLFPKWNIWTQFLVGDMRPALHLDALKHTHPIEVEVHHPSEIASVFDAVSYSKGASVIRMLADYLGEKDFRNGLRHYLKKHTHKNTVTEDLWRSLEKVSRKPVEKMMANWTGKAGYPVVSVSVVDDTLKLKQSRFFSSPLSAKESKDLTVWQIPMKALTAKGVSHPVLMDKKQVTRKAPRTRVNGWVKLNAGETSLFRTAYSSELLERLAQAVADKKLPTRDRLGLVRDLFALSESGDMQVSQALSFACNLQDETEYVVWAEIASSFATIHSLLQQEKIASRFPEFALQIFSRIGGDLPWSTVPKTHEQALLKVLVLGSLGRYGEKKTVSHARKLFASIGKVGKTNKIPADLRGVVYGTVARFGSAKEYQTLLKMYKSATLHEEKNRIAAALGGFCDQTLLKRTLEFALSKDVRPQDTVRMIASVSLNSAGTDLAWKFIQKNWKEFTKRYSGSRDLSHLLECMGVSASSARAKEIATFLKKHPAPGTERTVAQAIERINSNAAYLKREAKNLKVFLAA